MNEVIDHDPDFTWRGNDVTRIENLSDIVFALALGMLVSSSSPPLTVSELNGFLLSIVPVSAAFAILLLIWHGHYTYFRRYGLADGKAIFLNAILIFLVLFLAYPLRFIFDALFAYILSLFGNLERARALELSGGDTARMMAIYAAGYGLIFLVLHRMYAHALRSAETLALSAREIILTKITLWTFAGQIILSAFVAVGAFVTPFGAMSGFLWCLNWPAAWLIGGVYKPRLAALAAKKENETEAIPRESAQV